MNVTRIWDPLYFMGSLDEWRMWNRAINQDEVNLLCRFTVSDSDDDCNNNVSIPPNPAFDQCQVSSECQDILGTQVIDVSGRSHDIEMEVAMNEQFLDLSKYKSGYYQLVIRTRTGTTSSSLVILD